jgi:formylglycine-generating enzyme required for sulfatase activity
MQEIVGKTLAKYEILEQVGQGGMAQVYMACQLGLDRPVAVKVLSAVLAADPDFTKRFEREARSIASLNHPNIVQVYDFGVQDGYHYLVMNYVKDSRTLGSLMAEGAAIDQMLDYVVQVADALDYAHQHNILHRDVKPGNILIDERGALLSDFGLVRIGESASDLTVSGVGMGTPAYMSPEQAMGEEIDHRTDIYSLGVIVFQILTGKVPHEGTTPQAILVKRSIEPAPSLHEFDPDLPESFEQIVQRALARDPAERYQSAADFAEAIKRAQRDLYRQQVGGLATPEMGPGRGSDGAIAPRDERMARAAEPTERKRPWLVIASVVAAVLVIGVVIFFQFMGAGNDPGGDGSVAAQVENPANTPAGPVATEAEARPTEMPTPEGPALPAPAGMVKIPAGTYNIGYNASGDGYIPQRSIELQEFWIDLYEVTNAAYGAFLAETGSPAPAGWSEGTVPPGKEDHPVQGVTWELAVAYCDWAKKRLPSEAEWEIVARGAVGWLYPWGNDQHLVELPRTGTYAVGSVSGNRSPFGAFDMAGNAWEWVGETYAPVTDGNRVLRGGANDFLKDMAYRLQGDPNVPTMFATAGMRCAADRVGGR